MVISVVLEDCFCDGGAKSFPSPELGFCLVAIEALLFLPSKISIDPRQACLGTTPAVLSPLGGVGSYKI